MTRPRRLDPGSKVALVAPASPFRPEDLALGVEELTRIGFEPVYDPRVLERRGYVAGDAATRAAVIHDAWADPSIEALVAIRGGYGTAQVLPLLDPARMLAARKLFVGYSDTTALLAFHLAHGLACAHGPMIEGRIARGAEGYDRSSFLAAVSVPEPMGELAPDGLEILRPGEAAGPLVGGTLTQVAALLGTPFAFDPPPGAVLFLEDVAERPYRVDRLFTQLRQAGVLARASALVLGEFPRCDEPGGTPAIRDVLRELTDGFGGPVLFGFPSGHTTGPSWTLPFGVEVRVRASGVPALVVEEALVD
ncbi:MAG: LD-carboxypeptidase [Vicinamibacterales bacterium]